MNYLSFFDDVIKYFEDNMILCIALAAVVLALIITIAVAIAVNRKTKKRCKKQVAEAQAEAAAARSAAEQPQEGEAAEPEAVYEASVVEEEAPVEEEPVMEEEPQEEAPLEEPEEEPEVKAEAEEPVEEPEEEVKPAKQTARKKSAPAAKQSAKKEAVSDKTTASNKKPVTTKPATSPKKSAPSAISATQHSGKWIVSEKDGAYIFELRASNGGKLLHSSGTYSSVSGAKRGIETYKSNIQNGNFKVVQLKSGDYQYQILSANGRMIATGEDYKTKASCNNAVESTKKFAVTASVELPE